jgi:uncharacterized tellurite resistance protein B-like protein
MVRMFNRFLKSLMAPTEAQPTLSGASAMAALLVRLAKSDGHYAVEEMDGIEAILAARYGLDASKAEQLRKQGEALEDGATDTVRFTRALKNAVPHEDRASVMEALWSVVLADGKRDSSEDREMRLCADLLGINDRDSALARQRSQRL